MLSTCFAHQWKLDLFCRFGITSIRPDKGVMLLVLLGAAVDCKLAKSCIAAEGIVIMTLSFGMEGARCCVEVSVKSCFS